MTWIYRFFLVFVLLEIVAVCHYSGQGAGETIAASSLRTPEAVLQTEHDPSLLDFYEIVELRESKETSEEETDDATQAGQCLTPSFPSDGFGWPENLLSSTSRAIGSAATALFILYHRWKLPC